MSGGWGLLVGLTATWAAQTTGTASQAVSIDAGSVTAPDAGAPPVDATVLKGSDASARPVGVAVSKESDAGGSPIDAGVLAGSSDSMPSVMPPSSALDAAKPASPEVRPDAGAPSAPKPPPKPKFKPKPRLKSKSPSTRERSVRKSRRAGRPARARAPPPPPPPPVQPVLPSPPPEVTVPPVADVETASVTDDTQARALGWLFETFLKGDETEPPKTVKTETSPSPVATLWSVLRILVLVFLTLRLAFWAMRAGGRAGWKGAKILQRGWLMVEAATWAVTVGWLVTQVAPKESMGAMFLALMVVAFLLAISWTALRDVAAGIMLAAERPFAVGDFVRIQHQKGTIEGQVGAFRSRVIELETASGHRIRLPYRWGAEVTKVRPGGPRTAHAVELTLDVPESADPTEALRWAEELAISSPWAVLGVSPKIEWSEGQRATLRVEAYAFSREACAFLHASLMAGWKDILRKLKPTESSSKGP